MNETKYPASFRSKQHLIVSYDVFVNEQKHRLKMLYPFLSSDQIHGKLRSMWKNMNSKDRENYCKVASTPDKSLKGSRKQPLTFRSEKPQPDIIGCKAKRLRCHVESSVNQQDDTPFSKMEQCKIAAQCESYTNDFIPSNSFHKSSTDVKVSPRTVDVFCREESDNCTPAKQKYTKNYIKARHRPDCDLRLVPDVIDNTPSTKSGILKNKTQNAEALDNTQKRLSVSFSGNDLDEDLAIQPKVSSDGETYLDSDDDHDAVLLTKQNEEDEEEKDCENGTSSPPETKCSNVTPEKRTKRRSNHTQKKRKGSQSTCEEEKRECDIYNFEDIDKYEMFIETADMKKNYSKPEKILKRSSFEKDIQNMSKKIKGQNDINPMFKSPLENPMQNRHKQKGTLKERSDIKQVDSKSKRVSSLETPVLDLQITNKEESETTPLMDEGLQKLTLQEASRAPNKKKSSHYKAKSDSQANRHEDMKEKVTKSWMRTRSPFWSKAEGAQIGEKGDAKIKKTDHSEISGKCKKFINISAHKDSSYVISNSQKREPKTVHTVESDGELMNFDDDVDFDDFNTYESDLRRPYFRGFPSNNSIYSTIIRHSGLNIDSPLSINESGDSIAESFEVDAGESNNECGRNDALETALAKLRRMATLNNSPEVSSQSADSSPKLLSPALSGISKLKNHSLVNQDDLCNMFREVTPEGKKLRPKSGRRLVASAKVQSNSNFKDLFNSDEIF
ncbi:hypothetical protein ACJMK2_032690 [Sinanodonta woodiana]|uniref:Uncharacterized protein n=1 Tax=Sinanodonta woodiana TaxID=1069815 RepID=A0ABD3X6J5_SINWO